MHKMVSSIRAAIAYHKMRCIVIVHISIIKRYISRAASVHKTFHLKYNQEYIIIEEGPYSIIMYSWYNVDTLGTVLFSMSVIY